MRLLVAWRILTHEFLRTLLAIAGVFGAIVLVFLQLGFLGSVPIGSTLIYDALKFDLVIASRDYAFQIRPHYISRYRVYQAKALPEVYLAMPLYQRFGRWLNADGGLQRQIFVMGFDPENSPLPIPEVRMHHLNRRDTALIDRATRPVFGNRTEGSVAEVNGRMIKIVGNYELGTGFLGLGAMIVSDVNFIRLFPDQTLDKVQLGLVLLKPGYDAPRAAERLQAVLPRDTRVFTRQEFMAMERAYWVRATSTGLVFGSGTIVAAIVGTAILFQTLSVLVRRNLPEYATLKAIGHTERYLFGIIVALSILITLSGFLPAAGTAWGLYHLVRDATLLPVFMTIDRVAAVLVASMLVSLVGSALTLRTLRRADPVDLFR